THSILCLSVSYGFHNASVAVDATDAVAPCTLLHARPRFGTCWHATDSFAYTGLWRNARSPKRCCEVAPAIGSESKHGCRNACEVCKEARTTRRRALSE